MKRVPLLLLVFLSQQSLKAADFEKQPDVRQWDRVEISVPNHKTYSDPYRDVELLVDIVRPGYDDVQHFGFFDGENGWKVRFTADRLGKWKYTIRFSDSSEEIKGYFECLESDKPGRVMNAPYNPYWLTRSGHEQYLLRSFHIGDRFFAENWDDPENPADGEKRMQFLDWLQENDYNMISVASHYVNRAQDGRGQGWETPLLWPIDPKEYRKLEAILDLLSEREITVFPFAGLFGKKGSWPVDIRDQELYIKYFLARIGHYPNIILNIAGPEPLYKEDRENFKGVMRPVDIRRLGTLVGQLDIHDHIVTVHHEKNVTKYGDPFIAESWYDMSCLQGPTTTDVYELFSGLVMNHHRNKSVYAQETLWPGNKYHPEYTDEQIRRNALAILMSGSILNFADMDGNSSSGFSGTLDLADVKPSKHAVVKAVWDWFETIPYQRMISRQDLLMWTGLCLAEEGVEYYVLAPQEEKVELFLDFPYPLQAEWIDVADLSTKIPLEPVSQKKVFITPDKEKDWLLHVYAPKPKIVAEGNFPDLAVDSTGNIHLVYNRGGLRYKKYDAASKTWLPEQTVGCDCKMVERADPDIVIDSQDRPHVYCGNEYAWFDGNQWIYDQPDATRDSELVIDSEDTLYLVSRGGNHGGYIGFESKKATVTGWFKMSDPDSGAMGVNNHVYNDIATHAANEIHLVQRHGPEVEVTYRKSTDGGLTWPVQENVMDDREEAPHVAVRSDGTPFVSTGKGYILERTGDNSWKQHGRKVHTHGRMQPELGFDQNDNLYVTAFGGLYNVYFKEFWIGEKVINPVTEKSRVGFVETAAGEDFVYVVWEEGQGGPDLGLADNSNILVGMLYPDGRLIGLY